MSLSPRPLLATRADAELYAWRPGIDDPVRNALDRGRNALVVGDHGSGRTSLLHAHARALRQQHRSVVYVDGRALDDAVQIVRAVVQEVEAEGHPPAAPAAAGAALNPVLAALRDLPPARGVVVMLDDPDPREAFELFGRNRDRVWELDYTWIVATTPEGAGTLHRPPADAFFERRVELDGLTLAERRDVLRRRSPGLPPAAEHVLMVHAPDNLREFVAVASRIADGDVDPARYALGIEKQQRRAENLGHSAAVALDEVAALEPVSASDARLLQRLRWSKARASRVLNQLEEAGLLVTETAESDGPGRPRKLYRTRPPELLA